MHMSCILLFSKINNEHIFPSALGVLRNLADTVRNKNILQAIVCARLTCIRCV